VIGDDYDAPRVRLPGAGGAPEIAASCRSVLIVMRQSPRSFVERVDFVTSVGFGRGGDDRERYGFRGRGPRAVITDVGVLEPDPETRELVLTRLHAGVTVGDARAATGWELRVARRLETTEPPSPRELEVLRELVQTSASRPAVQASR
jgi:glutaconate CoA-transferase subunit B